MKCRLFLLTIVGVFLIAACSSGISNSEEPAVNVVEALEIEIEETVSDEVDSDMSASSIDSDMEGVSFSQEVWPIIKEYALTAHGGKGGVFLENYTDIMNYVESGDPEGSYLYRALIGDGVDQMPPGNPLPEELIQIIYNWIEQGAKEN